MQDLKPGRLNPQQIIVVLSACMALYMTSFVIILPLFARRFGELGAGVEALGISAAVYALTSTLAAPIMGALADRFGRRPLVLVALTVNTAAFCGYLIASSAAAFVILRGLAGAFTAGLAPAVTGLAADLAPRDRQAQWIGFLNAGASLGWMAGPVAGGLLYDRWGYSTAVTVSILLALLTLLAALVGIPQNRPAARPSDLDGKRRQPKNLRSCLRDLRITLPGSLPSFTVLLAIFFAVLLAWAFIEPRFMFYAYSDLGWSSSRLGLAMSAYGLAMVVGELTLGRLSDRQGRMPVIILGLLLFSAQFFGLALSRNYIWITAAFVTAGLGNAIYDPALSASILDISPIEHRSRILGIKSMVGSAGSILGPVLLALLSSSLEARTIFLLAAGMVMFIVLTALVYAAGGGHARRSVRHADPSGSTG